ncbi:MAG TPA: alpha/beta hydrolase [Balneolaceae bacterium]
MFGASKYKVHTKNGFDYLHIANEEYGTKNLVLLHGMFGGLSNYDPLLSRLQGYNIFVPAIPIYDFKTSRLKISHLTSWLHSFFETVNVEKPVLLGNSMGGHLALDYTIKYPEQILALVLTGSSGLMEKNFGSSFPRRNDREYIRKQAALTFYEDLIDDVILDEIMEVINNRTKLIKLLAITRDTHKYNMEQYLTGVKQDVLLIWGRNDEITPPEVAVKFHQKLPSSQLHWIDKCGHAPMMEHPETFANYLNQFLIQQQNKRKIITDYEEEDHSHL